MYSLPSNPYPGTQAWRRLATQKVCIVRCSNVSIVGPSLGTLTSNSPTIFAIAICTWRDGDRLRDTSSSLILRTTIQDQHSSAHNTSHVPGPRTRKRTPTVGAVARSLLSLNRSSRHIFCRSLDPPVKASFWKSSRTLPSLANIALLLGLRPTNEMPVGPARSTQRHVQNQTQDWGWKCAVPLRLLRPSLLGTSGAYTRTSMLGRYEGWK